MGMVDILVMWPRPPSPPLNKLSFPRPMEAPYEISLLLAQCFLRRRLSKCVEDRWWMDDRGCLYYKLTYEPTGSGELKP